MKRTCFGCKAFIQLDGYIYGYICGLNYPIETTAWDSYLGIHKIVRPKIDCPKPKTNKQLINSDSYNPARHK